MTLIVPVAYFAALDRGSVAPGAEGSIVNDTVRGQFLVMSRGISVIMLIVYVCSRIFLADPPGDNNAFMVHPDAPEGFKLAEKELEEEEAESGPWVCIIMMLVAVGIMAYTAEALVENVDFVRAPGGIGEESVITAQGNYRILTVDADGSACSYCPWCPLRRTVPSLSASSCTAPGV